MQWIVAKMKWIMIVSGALTCTMVYAAIDPQAALMSTFGTTLEGPLAEIVVRNWGALITLVGGLLIYGAYHPSIRPLILVIAGLSKLIFIALVLGFGRQYLGQAGIAIVVDGIFISLFSGYLFAIRSRQGVAA